MTMINPKFILVFLILLFSKGFIYSQTENASTVSNKNLVKEFFCEEIIYPEEDLKKGIEGEVELSFRVEKDGSVSHIEVVNSVSNNIDKETIRVFKMLEWKPAFRLGYPVVSQNTYSLKYNIKKYKKHCKSRGYEHSSLPYTPADSSMKIYKSADVDSGPYPVFKGKNRSMNEFIAENIEYPAEAYKQDLSGTVILKFRVEPHGRISNITLEKGVGGGCSQEAIRLAKLLYWMPGIKNEIAVRTRVKLDISFNLLTESGHSFFNSNQMNTQ